ncbi:MAG: PAS domain-containing sensor histidine kinase [Candidatus Obscuribacterales bacterium]|nr:PAS domain-containing sensor histidine kinase [Candidatus Obscuribacterales bacterium]
MIGKSSATRLGLFLSILFAIQLLTFACAVLFVSEQSGNASLMRTALSFDRILLESGITAGAVGYDFGNQVLPVRARAVLKKNLSEPKRSSDKAEEVIRVLERSSSELQAMSRLSAGQPALATLGDSLTDYLKKSHQFFATRESIYGVLFPGLLLISLVTTGIAALGYRRFFLPIDDATKSLPVLDQEAISTARLQDLAQLTMGATGALSMRTKYAKNYLDNMPVGLVSADANGVVQSANLRALKMMRCTVDKALGTQLQDLLKLSDHEGNLSLPTLLEKCTDHVVEARLPCRDGSAQEVPVDVSLAEFTSTSGDGYIMNIVDVSDRYEIERLKQDFLSMVSHDLRTPLTTIGIFLQSLNAEEPSCLPEHSRRAAVNSEREVERLVRMVSSLLDIAKIRSGKLELHPAPFELEAFLDQLKRNLSRLAEKRGVSLDTKTVSDFVVADQDRIYQVVENLVGNALKFSPPGSTVFLEAKPIAEGMRIEVRDSGPGVPEDKRQIIFERFGQVSVEDSTVRGGTGLGLAICKLIVEQHGGSIGVDSEMGKGSCFWFTLPD